MGPGSHICRLVGGGNLRTSFFSAVAHICLPSAAGRVCMGSFSLPIFGGESIVSEEEKSHSSLWLLLKAVEGMMVGRRPCVIVRVIETGLLTSCSC